MLLSFGLPVLGIALLLYAFAWWTMTSGHNSVESVADTGNRAVLSLATASTLLGQERGLAGTADSPQKVRANAAQIGRTNAEVARLIDEVATSGSASAQTFQEIEAGLSAISQLAQQAAATGVMPVAELDLRFNEVSDDLSVVVGLKTTEANEILETAERDHTRNQWLLVVLGILTAMAALLVVLAVSRRLSRRIEHVAEMVDLVADGDMSARTDDEEDDEIGRIARSLNTLVERVQQSIATERHRMDTLNEAMHEVAGFVDRVASGDLTAKLELGDKGLGGFGLSTNLNRMIDGLAQISREVSLGTMQISTSASQILAIVSNQNSATAEQAASINQTGVTVDEVRVNSEQVAARASELADHAHRASAISTEGGRAVSTLLAGMDEITRRMDVVSVQVRELAERSTAIGTINDTVTDLADQSNMLALNATIEAARAGEQGRGFAVVADQVRTLAEQSKQATMQVQAILQEIHAASKRAVEAADAGAQVVAAGRSSAGETGVVITQLGEAVRQTAEVAVQIATGAREQATGMDQIGLAMGDVRETTRRLADGAAETEVAAGSLNSLADRLAGAASRYRLSE